MNEDFLLTTPIAVRLYHNCAKMLPLIDYHNHISYDDVAKDKIFDDLAELWLLGDPYKHRAMRACGIREEYITGEASHFQKFYAWCSIFPRLVGHPLHHWSVMELKRIFGIETKLDTQSAQEIWKEANEKLSSPEFSARNLLRKFDIEYCAPCCCVTDDISVYAGDKCMTPSFRGDAAVLPTSKLIHDLEEYTETRILNISDFKKALSLRLNAFHTVGCRFADHALDNGFRYRRDDGNHESRFLRILKNEVLSEEDKGQFISEMLRFLGSEYEKRHWVMQLHIGALRHTSSRLRRIAGVAGGYAGIGNCNCISGITKFLDDLDQLGRGLPRTVLFTLNPADNAAVSVLSGSYSKDGVSGLVQQGPAWWWCDHLQGMREVFDTISTYGILSNFIGMTTDSRSLLSFVRHEYFRRALCGWIGEKVCKGEFPDDYVELEHLVTNICYANAKNILDLSPKVSGQVY